MKRALTVLAGMALILGSAACSTDSTTPQNSAQVEGAPCEGDGHWVRLDGGNAGHYGTEWLCQH